MARTNQTDSPVDDLINTVFLALARDPQEHFPPWLAELADAADPDWVRAVDQHLLRRLTGQVSLTWQRGWQPAEVARMADREKQGSKTLRSILGDLMAAELRTYAPTTIDELWHDQLSVLGARVWWPSDDGYFARWAERERVSRAEALSWFLRALVLMWNLPGLAQLGPLPGQARPRASRSGNGAKTAAVDEKMLARVRNLLAKAESTQYPAEAETFTAAAQAMMARHSIDEALLSHGPQGSEDRPAGRRVLVDPPYTEPKSLLLHKIAQANRCRAVWDDAVGLSTILGYPADLDWVELLYTSLLVQAERAMVNALQGPDSARTRTRAFRGSFLQSFAQRIGERLDGATAEAMAAAVDEAESHGQGEGGSLLPVLKAREEAVNETTKSMFPNLVTTKVRIKGPWDAKGWNAGRSAADLAALSGHGGELVD